MPTNTKNEDYYLYKAQKYRHKYHQLKSMIGGGDNDVTTKKFYDSNAYHTIYIYSVVPKGGEDCNCKPYPASFERGRCAPGSEKCRCGEGCPVYKRCKHGNIRYLYER